MIWLGYILGGVLSGTIVACLFYKIMKSMRIELKVMKIDLKYITEENKLLRSRVEKYYDENFELRRQIMFAENKEAQYIRDEINKGLASERAALKELEEEILSKRINMRDELELEIYRKITGRLGGKNND